MARSYATVGQMLTYAVDRSALSPDLEIPAERHVRVEVILRHMLEFVLMSPRSRDAFLRTIARTEHTTGSIAAAPRMRKTSPDLLAELLPIAGEADEGARLGIALRVGGPFSTARLREMRAALGSSPQHLLVAIARHTDRAELEGEVPDGVIATSWARVARRMPKADPGHAHLWETLGEVGENAGRPVVQFPVDAKKLLTRTSTAREFRAHLDVLHHASRTLLGTSPHFSTRRGQTGAHLQAGVGRQRTGLEFGEVEQGTPVHFQRTGEMPIPLGIGRLETEEERAAATERLAMFSRRTWRTEAERPPASGELIGAPASPELEGARLLLWALFNPMLLRDRGFEPAPAKRQPALTATSMGLRLLQRGDDSGAEYRLWVGGDRDWKNLIPRVTREETARHPAETYAIAPRKSQSTADFVWEVHRALRSLTIL
ncbi:hypothetical protein GCM10023160_31660 [Brachybacterium paraconglomeratum]|uniref:hypothetical protein n=1 Tax=Brachybacterium paraconglomeratum TaxID=173362 RepID=UPI0031E71BAB